jgi:hypothetical protein
MGDPFLAAANNVRIQSIPSIKFSSEQGINVTCDREASARKCSMSVFCQKTTSIPIVVAAIGDAKAAGIVHSVGVLFVLHFTASFI